MVGSVWWSILIIVEITTNRYIYVSTLKSNKVPVSVHTAVKEPFQQLTAHVSTAAHDELT